MVSFGVYNKIYTLVSSLLVLLMLVYLTAFCGYLGYSFLFVHLADHSRLNQLIKVHILKLDSLMMEMGKRKLSFQMLMKKMRRKKMMMISIVMIVMMKEWIS